MSTVYIVDDDESVLASLKSILLREGYAIETANSPEAFLKAVEQIPPAIAVLDIFFGPNRIDGEELVKILGDRWPDTQCIIISGESDIPKTLACMRQGALDFIEKPVGLPRLITSVRNAMDLYNIKSASRDKCRILGKSRIMQEIIARVKKLAGLNESVLITGETGTGKELIAENLHLFSKRYSLPMVKVNCSALNPNLLESELFGHRAGSFTGADRNKKGFFEAAHGSALFIDEIADFPLNLQSKILRTIQEKIITPVGSTDEIPVDVRLVFATHRNLKEMVRSGLFREDLFFRISTFTIELPPLRERIEDISELAPFFLNRFLAENALPLKLLSVEAMAKLKEHHYPGNIRELSKIIKNAAFFSEADTITAQDVNFHAGPGNGEIWEKTNRLSLIESKDIFEKELIQRRMKSMGNDVRKVAESLGMIRNNLYRKLKHYGIKYGE
ncbi:MAG TPA: sigma-54 dependent transcriptional regulator [Chitinivibrionales bacterium]